MDTWRIRVRVCDIGGEKIRASATVIAIIIFIVSVNTLSLVSLDNATTNQVTDTFIDINGTSISINSTTADQVQTNSTSVTAGTTFEAVPKLNVVWNIVAGLPNFFNAPFDLMEQLDFPEEIRKVLGSLMVTLYILAFVLMVFRV